MVVSAWGGIDQEARHRVLAALEGHGELTANQVGLAVNRHAAAAMQMMYALFDEGLVDYRRDKSRYLWWRTATPAPLHFSTSTAHAMPAHVCAGARGSWTSAALCDAMNVPRGAAVKPAARVVHKIK